MEMTNDLLVFEECIVTDVVDRYQRTSWLPMVSVEPQLPSRPPRLALDPRGRFAEQCLLRRVQQPRLVAVPGNAEELWFAWVDRSSDWLQSVVTDLDRDCLTECVCDRLDVSRGADLVQLACSGTGSLAAARRDAGSGDLGQVMGALGIRQPH
jgi:hypothetical protein